MSVIGVDAAQAAVGARPLAAISSEGPREISEWMDEFYQEDGDRKLAWELFKNETEDNGLQGDPSRVPAGVGPQYLRRIKLGGEHAIARFTPLPTKPVAASPTEKASTRKTGTYLVGGICVALIAVAIAVFATKKPGAGIVQGQANLESPAEPSNVSPPPTEKRQSTQPEVKDTGRADFQAAVARYRISGKIGGQNLHVIVDGQAYRIGDLIDHRRGIWVQKIEPRDRSVEFADHKGNAAVRRLD